MLSFLSNNTALPASTIATLTWRRLPVELFSTWIKQPLRIDLLLGASSGMVKMRARYATANCAGTAIVKSGASTRCPVPQVAAGAVGLDRRECAGLLWVARQCISGRSVQHRQTIELVWHQSRGSGPKPCLSLTPAEGRLPIDPNRFRC
jgi:hypothetical protein